MLAQEAALEADRLESGSHPQDKGLTGTGRPRYCRKCQVRCIVHTKSAWPKRVPLCRLSGCQQVQFTSIIEFPSLLVLPIYYMERHTAQIGHINAGCPFPIRKGQQESFSFCCTMPDITKLCLTDVTGEQCLTAVMLFWVGLWLMCIGATSRQIALYG